MQCCLVCPLRVVPGQRIIHERHQILASFRPSKSVQCWVLSLERGYPTEPAGRSEYWGGGRAPRHVSVCPLPRTLTHPDTNAGEAKWMSESVFTCLSALHIIYLLCVCTSEELQCVWVSRAALRPSLFCSCVERSAFPSNRGGHSFVFLFFVRNWILVPKNSPPPMWRRTGDPQGCQKK